MYGETIMKYIIILLLLIPVYAYAMPIPEWIPDTVAVYNVRRDQVYDRKHLNTAIAQSISGDSFEIGSINDTGTFTAQVPERVSFTNSIIEYIGRDNFADSQVTDNCFIYENDFILLRIILNYNFSGLRFSHYTYLLEKK